MKKNICCFILLLNLIFCSYSVEAESIDLPKFNMSEKVDYQDEIYEVNNIYYDYIHDEWGYIVNNNFVPESHLKKVIIIPLKERYHPEVNLGLLKYYFENTPPGTTLMIPEGEFLIGTKEQDFLINYIKLPSNKTIIGDFGSKLLISDVMIWFGFATGNKQTDGINNLKIKNLTIEAYNKSKGAWFMAMINHGNNIEFTGNKFTQVHKKSSHILDLGGVTNVVIQDNIFEGYAPELTNINQKDNRHGHNWYSEAIQFDQSTYKLGWDGGYLRKIDPNYIVNNQNHYISDNIQVLRNFLIPYIEDGKIISYAGSIGQHSSEVGNIIIQDNIISGSILNRFKNEGKWVMNPIHIPPNSSHKVILKDNKIN